MKASLIAVGLFLLLACIIGGVWHIWDDHFRWRLHGKRDLPSIQKAIKEGIQNWPN